MEELVIQITEVFSHPNTGQDLLSVWEYKTDEMLRAKDKFMRLKKQESEYYSVAINIVIKKTEQ